MSSLSHGYKDLINFICVSSFDMFQQVEVNLWGLNSL